MKLRKRGGALCGACAEETPEKRALTLGLGADSPGPAAPPPPSPQPAAAGSPCLGGGGETGGVPRSPHPDHSLLALTSALAQGLPGEAAPLKTQGIPLRTTSWPLPLTLKRGPRALRRPPTSILPLPSPRARLLGGSISSGLFCTQSWARAVPRRLGPTEKGTVPAVTTPLWAPLSRPPPTPDSARCSGALMLRGHQPQGRCRDPREGARLSWPACRESLLPWCSSRVSTNSSRACIFRVCSKEAGGKQAWWLPEPMGAPSGWEEPA